MIKIIEQSGGKVHLSNHVDNIVVENGRAAGLKLGKIGTKITSPYSGYIKTKIGILCNADIWSIPRLLKGQESKLTESQRQKLLIESKNKAKTKSFLHLHLGSIENFPHFLI